MTRLTFQLLGTLLILGLLLKYWWLIALAITAAVLYRRVPQWWASHEASVAAERSRLAGVAARADVQHAQCMAGDVRGVWGVADAAMRDYEREARR